MEKEALKIDVRDIKDGDWYWIPRTVFEDFAFKIGVIGLALYNAYASYARDKGFAFPSQRTISEKLGISLKTIRKYNRVLLENGLIKVERRKGKSNLVTLPKVGGRNQLPNGWESVTHSDGEEVPPKDNKFKENTNVADYSAVYDIISFFNRRVEKVWGVKPVVSWSKSVKLVRERLRDFSSNQLKDIISWFLESKHCERLGFSLSTCLSEYVINLWKKENLV